MQRRTSSGIAPHSTGEHGSVEPVLLLSLAAWTTGEEERRWTARRSRASRREEVMAVLVVVAAMWDVRDVGRAVRRDGMVQET